MQHCKKRKKRIVRRHLVILHGNCGSLHSKIAICNIIYRHIFQVSCYRSMTVAIAIYSYQWFFRIVVQLKNISFTQKLLRNTSQKCFGFISDCTYFLVQKSYAVSYIISFFIMNSGPKSSSVSPLGNFASLTVNSSVLGHCS